MQSLEDLRSSISKDQEQVTAWQNEVQSEFKKTLTDQEQQTLDTLSTKVQALRKQSIALTNELSDLEVKKTTLEDEVHENLEPRLDQLKMQQFDDDSQVSTKNGHSKLRSKLEKEKKAATEVAKQLAENNKKIDAKLSSIEDMEKEKNKLFEKQQEEARDIERHQQAIEAALNKKATLIAQYKEAQRSMRDVGSVPDGAIEKYARVQKNQASFLSLITRTIVLTRNRSSLD